MSNVENGCWIAGIVIVVVVAVWAGLHLDDPPPPPPPPRIHLEADGDGVLWAERVLDGAPCTVDGRPAVLQMRVRSDEYLTHCFEVVLTWEEE